MPTVFSHAIIGVSSAYCAPKTQTPVRLWVLSLFCAIVPDADVLAFKLGIPYAHFFGHRGFFHSLLFACMLGFVLVPLFFSPRTLVSKKGLLLGLYFSAVGCSHGLLDAFTNGGLGIALLSPFDRERYFFWATPISVSPINPERFFSVRGVQVLKNEMLWIWLPAMGSVLVSMIIKRLKKQTT